MASSSITKQYNDLPKIARIILQIFLGWIISGVYRIIKWTETKNTVTLIVGIIALIPGPDFIFQIVDLVTTILNDKFTILVD
ncbi:MAG: hypothetical protein IKV43_03880 [Clostridia bacterium]|nr:hypothetical protein [Clostridia bacterium]